jgi:hypothetical protein
VRAVSPRPVHRRLSVVPGPGLLPGASLVGALVVCVVLTGPMVGLTDARSAVGPSREPVVHLLAAETDAAEVRAALRAAPQSGPVDPVERITVISAGEGLEGALVTTVADLDGVIATTRVRSATVGLFGSMDAEGVARDVLAPGFRIPVTVTALDPDDYLATHLGLSLEDAARLVLLAPGRVLLSASSAALRGIGAGGTVDLGGVAGLEVVGIVDDRAARGSEFLVHREDADAIGLGSREALLVRHTETRAEALASMFEGGEDDVRVWQDGEHVRLVLSQVELKARFGEFAFRLVPNQREVDIDRAFIAEHIVIQRMPVLGNVRCHRLVMDDLRAALEEIVDAGLEDWLVPRRFGGCFHPRRIAFGRENLSRHSWGIAIDLNVDFSLPGSGPVPPDAFIAIMGRHGFRWGGDFTSPDNHHFEWVGEAAQHRPVRPRA